MRPQPTPPPGATNFSFTFNINGLSFSTTHVMHRAALGTTEEWTVQSTDWVALHIFHVRARRGRPGGPARAHGHRRSRAGACV